ncbi:gp53-like domain-containing protein [Citrobacter sp. B72]|uniref:gp53-like domain-containing protein n=1 Tax=Citrobacter sp. B72 TaxID=2807631 RepID=UPI001EF642F8|nr:hypothetical protein [Citrobacter sp. B72]
MALTLLAANNAQTVLAAGISASATSLTVNSGTGSLFPAPSDGVSFFKLTLIDAATGQLTEIMHVTARTGDTMTIERGQEGTTARAWSANDIAANMMTAGTLSYILGNFQPLDPTLTALAALVGVANKLPYFNGDDTAALTDLTQVGRDIIGKSTIADILTYLGLDRINQIPTETIIKLGPDGNKQLFINNGAWGAWDADLNKAIPLSVAQGGIGSTTASGGRTNLGLGNSSTRDVGTTNGTVMAGDDSRVSTLKTAAYKDIGTGAGQVPDMSSFVSNKSVNGRMELPGGVIRQWGVIQVPGNATTEFNFPVPFPSAAYVVVGSFQVPASGSVNMTPLSRTTFNAQNSYATAQYACWIAEGA